LRLEFAVGISILRAHDVKEMLDVVKVVMAIGGQ